MLITLALYIVKFETETCDSSNLLLFQDILAYSRLLHFHMNFRISLSISAKKKKRKSGNFDFERDCNESVDQFGENCYPNIKAYSSWMWKSFYLFVLINLFFMLLILSRRVTWSGFLGSSVVKNLPANAGDTGSIPGQGDPTCGAATKPMCHQYRASALEPGGCNHWTHVLQPLKPVQARARASKQEKPLQWEVRTPQLESSPRLPKLLKKSPNKNKDPAQPKIK